MAHEQLANSDHNSGDSATAISVEEARLLERLSELYGSFSLYTGEHNRQLGVDLNELRRLRALADERFFHRDDRIERDKGPPKLWDVRMMAKQLGVAEDVVRRRARSWQFTLCVAHQRCRGGKRGCDLRFIASEAADWVNKQRAKR
jgi:hypothetical protein